MLIVTQVNERDVRRLAVGAPGEARLMGGEPVSGRIRHISAVADEATRTFRVELEVANADSRIADGMTAEIALPLSATTAHRVSPAETGRATGREGGCKYVEIRVVAVSLKNKNKNRREK